MRHATHQTVRLSRGRHRSPDEAVCAMELASMLTGSTFSDRCARVCPTLAAFVRGYNDNVSDARRQDLIALVPALVDSRAGEAAASERARRCRALATTVYRRRRWKLPWSPRFPHGTRELNAEWAGAILGRAARADAGVHAETLRFLGELLSPCTGPPEGERVGPWETRGSWTSASTLPWPRRERRESGPTTTRPPTRSPAAPTGTV